MIQATKQCPLCNYQGIYNLADDNYCPNDNTPLQRIFKNISVGDIIDDDMVKINQLMLGANFKSDLRRSSETAV